MMKYFKYTVFFIGLFFAINLNVFALDCYYTSPSNKPLLQAHFRINENTNKVIFSGVSGSMESKDSDNSDINIREVKGQGQSVENWNKIFKSGTNDQIEFSGSDYYKTNRRCPPYAMLIDRLGQFDLIVTDAEYKKDFDVYANNKQGHQTMHLVSIDAESTVIHYPSSCLGLNKSSCELNKNFACVWNEDESLTNGGYCNVDNLQFVGCGGARDIPVQVPALISFFVNLLKIATPLILIFVSIITLVKAMASSKEDEIKKAQSSLVKKIIAAVLVFFVITIVQFVISKVAATEEEAEGFSSCLSCFLNNECENSTYYKTNIAGQDYCTNLGQDNFELCEEEKKNN